MGKYDEVLARLKPLPVHPKGQKFQDRINEQKRKYLVDVSITDSAMLVKLYATARREKRAIQAQLKEVNLRLEALSSLLGTSYEQSDIKSLLIEGFGTVRRQPEPYAQVQDRDQFREWAKKEGYERSLILPWQTTNSVTKELLLKGLPEPDGVKAFIKDKVVFTRDDAPDEFMMFPEQEVELRHSDFDPEPPKDDEDIDPETGEEVED